MATKTYFNNNKRQYFPPLWIYFSKWLGLLFCLALFGFLSTKLSAQASVSFSHGDDRSVAFGDTVSIPLIAENLNDIQSIQFNLHFNPHVLSFVEINALDTTSGIFSDNIGLSETVEGRIFFVALGGAMPIEMTDGDTLCNIVFTATGTPGSSTLFGVQGYPLQLQAFDGADFIPFEPSAIQISVTTSDSPGFTYSICNNPDSAEAYDLRVNFFGDTISYPFSLIQTQQNDTVLTGNLFPDSSHIISNLATGNYQLVLSSPLDSTVWVDSLNVTAKGDLAPLFITQSASCPQIPDGSIELPFIEGANPPYTVLWPDSTLHFRAYEELLPGVYEVIIIDEDHCAYNVDVEVEGPEAIVQETVVSATCETSEDGSLMVDVLNLDRFQDSTLLFSLTGTDWFQTTALQIVSIPTGPFTYFIQDTSGCIYTQNVTIPFDNTIQLENINQVDPRCFGTNDGLVSATARLDIVRPGDFVFDWSGPNPSITDSFFLAVGLRPDSFTLQVTHTALPSSCFDSQTIVLEDTDSLEFDFELEAETCFGQNDGVISITPAGGTLPYSYSWTDGNNDSLRTGLQPGSYELEIADANFCSQSASFIIDTGLRISWTEVDVQSVNCFGNENGAVSFTIDTQYRSNIDLEYALTPSNIDSVKLDSLSSSIEELSGGTYTLSILSSSGCMLDSTIIIEEPEPILLDTFSIRSGDCNLPNAQINISTFGGNGGPFQFSWSNGQEGELLDSVLNGDYVVTVSDDEGCIDSFSFSIPTPPSPILDSFIIEEPNCFGDTSASVLLIYDNSQDYNFEWNTGDTTTELGPIASGIYQVTISTNRNCRDTISIEVNEPDSISIDFETQNETDGQSNGLAVAIVTGGLPPYQFFWNTAPIQTDSVAMNLSAGRYEVLVIDANNCRNTDTVRIDGLTHLNGPLPSQGLTLWPNPNSGRFYLNHKTTTEERPSHLVIYDQSGRRVSSAVWPENQNQVNLFQPSSGLYYIHVLYYNGTQNVIPVIVQQ